MKTPQESRNGSAGAEPIVAVQQGLACWSRAWTQLAHGMMSVTTAQIDFAREVLRPTSQNETLQFRDPHVAAHAWVRLSRKRFEEGVKLVRRMNDELAASVFAAADTLADGFEAGSAAALPTPPQPGTADRRGPGGEGKAPG
jgi:hypothetical protein